VFEKQLLGFKSRDEQHKAQYICHEKQTTAEKYYIFMEDLNII
jgi:hypothetical protein